MRLFTFFIWFLIFLMAVSCSTCNKSFSNETKLLQHLGHHGNTCGLKPKLIPKDRIRAKGKIARTLAGDVALEDSYEVLTY